MRPVDLNRLALDRPVIRPPALYVLLFILAFRNSKGYSPTLRDIMEECNWHSPHRSDEVIKQLTRTGLLTKETRSPRSLMPTVRFIPANQQEAA